MARTGATAGWVALAALVALVAVVAIAGFARFVAGDAVAPSLATAAASASTRLSNAASARALGTPSLPSARAVRSSKIVSSLSHWALALWPTSPAIAVILPATSARVSSAADWVLRCTLAPSFFSASNTLLPPLWALANAPRPASQICCAESLTVCASWLSSRPPDVLAEVLEDVLADPLPGAVSGLSAASADLCIFLTMLVLLWSERPV